MNLVFPGTFNPFHLGHLDIVKRASTFLREDETLFIGLAVNPSKPATFMSVENRVHVIERSCMQACLKNVAVEKYTDSTISYCRLRNARLVRGLRNSADFEYEKPMAVVNKEHGIETMFFMTDSRYAHISSSLIRNMLAAKLDIDKYVSSSVTDVVNGAGGIINGN